MSGRDTQNRWIGKVVEHLRAMAGVEHEVLKNGRIALNISYDGESRTVPVAVSASDYRAQKEQFSRIRETLTELGIREGMKYVPARPSRKPVSPDMLAARAKRQKEFDAWQAVWRTIREAERSLDVEYEIAQMIDYY